MAKIIENVLRRKDHLKTNPILIGQNVAMAIAAMSEGAKSTAWESYMKQYARDEAGNIDTDLLARLMGTDDTDGDPIMDRKRCYLVGNALCAMTTITDLDYGVESIDDRIGTVSCSRFGGPCEDPNNSAQQAGG
jgi:hypothetical protein